MKGMRGRSKAEILKESYEGGDFVVEPGKVAEKIVEDAVRRIRERGRRKGGDSRPPGRDQAK